MAVKTVALVALRTINNVGEELLDINTEYLLKKTNSNLKIKKIELNPSKGELLPKYFLQCVFAKVLRFISDILPICNYKFIIKNLAYKIKLTPYFKEKLKDIDDLIYCVGMLKYSTQDFSYIYNIINKIASQNNISIMMSAMSIENSNKNDWRCRQLKEAVNCSSVKFITTRDNIEELELLRSYYLYEDSNVISRVVGDPALWTKQTYEIREKRTTSTVIGVGLIRLNIYKDYGYNITEEELYDFYKKILLCLSEKGYNWKLFCNGMEEDYKVGERLINELSLSKDKLCARPKDANDLITLLSGFQRVLGARLHSCITSYALGIPVVGLIWDNKLRAFAKKIEHDEFFIEPENLNVEYVVDRLEAVTSKEYNLELMEELKNSTYKSIKEFIESDYREDEQIADFR